VWDRATLLAKEVAVNGSANSDSLYGRNGGPNVLYGLGGNDTLSGGDGADLANGGDGNDVLNGYNGLDFLEGGAGDDTLSDTSGSGFFNGGAGVDRLTGGAAADFLFGGTGNDIVATGDGNDVIAFNRGDGSDTVTVGAGAKTLSLGGGITYADMALRKNGDDLVLEAGGGEGVTFKNWYTGSANRNVLTLQVVAEAMAGFAPGGADPLRDQKVEQFDFKGLVGAFDAARAANSALTTWAVSSALAAFQHAGSDTAALGGDLAWQYGRNGTLAGIGLTPAQQVLGDAGFGSVAQTLRPLTALQDGAFRLS